MRSELHRREPSPTRTPDGLYLISCVSRKLAVPGPAQDLYTSALFRKARAFVERRGQPWYVLSAKYGLVRPEQVIEPYDRTLTTMGAAARRQWASRVMAQLQPELDGVAEVVFLAGRRYREFLEPPLERRGARVRVPMAGLPIGKQLVWLKHHTDG